MKTLYKILFSFLLIFSMLPVEKSFAHSCKPWGESYGFSIDCQHHTGTDSITYEVGPMTSAYAGYITAGANKWGTTNVVVFYKSNSSNYIHTYSDPNSSANAAFYLYSSNSSGHLLQWAIKMNTSNMNNRSAALNNTTMAHEFGHAIGLNDLYNSNNNDLLMYGYSNRTVASPQTLDILGAKHILGKN
ncbi:hypothetical protein I2483_17850 [Sporosarcina sp. E16_3]|uniref:hypothetical protein n=1 Tax=Sporosarcina sp. E16_3 TaxID=2789293 RepID=UPI001A929808|nr:hypothetical protein [Sporosarcina sp. E16_3]MBO0603533.1 hypothetical protein [Sporosarcina sp. E16_3]